MEVQAFSYVLTYSPRKAYTVYPSCDLYALMTDTSRHSTDSKAALIAVSTIARSRWYRAGKAHSQSTIRAFWHSRLIRVSTARSARRAKCQASAERAFWDFRAIVPHGRSFRDLDHMRAQLVDWVDQIVDPRRRHGRTCSSDSPRSSPIWCRCRATPTTRACHLPRVQHRRLRRLGRVIATLFPMTT